MHVLSFHKFWLIAPIKIFQCWKCHNLTNVYSYMKHMKQLVIYMVLTWIFLQKLPFSIPIGHPYSQIPGRQHHATHAAGQELEKKTKKTNNMSLRPIPHSILAAKWNMECCRRIFSISLLLFHKTRTVLLEQLFVIQDPRHPCTQLYLGKSGTFNKGRDKELCVICVLTSPTSEAALPLHLYTYM